MLSEDSDVSTHSAMLANGSNTLSLAVAMEGVWKPQTRQPASPLSGVVSLPEKEKHAPKKESDRELAAA